MASSQIAETARVIFSLIAYCSLFAFTIRQNRNNRGVVLGVVTVGMFAGFLYYAYLAEKHTRPWLLTTVEAVIILMGLSVLAFVALDVFRWATGKREPAAQGKDQSADSGLGSQ
jgi:4-amino-4-deoxy-L-arabinose transferase-like glycosyltransferase